MQIETKIAIFKGKKIRRHWDKKHEKWYFSVVDIVAVLTNQHNFQLARNYWKVLKNRLKKEGSEVVTNCNWLKMIAGDGKLRETDAADVETVLRLIQWDCCEMAFFGKFGKSSRRERYSKFVVLGYFATVPQSIPSPNVEPIKLWLAKVGYERIQETVNPEQSINRGRKKWQKMGRSEKWIQQRMMGQEIRNKLTDYWKNNDVKEQNEYAVLTNIIHEEWSELSVKQHKNLKKLKTENLRDHMTEAKLVFTVLAELSTRQIAETMIAKGLEENKIPAKKGGRIAKNARLELEEKTGRKVVSGDNFKLSNKNSLKELS